MFPVTSRYAGVETAERVEPDGRRIRYLCRRFVPATSSSVLAEHVVVEGERLDHIAARYLEDPEQFWRICDANRALLPRELVAEVGRRLRIPDPLEG